MSRKGRNGILKRLIEGDTSSDPKEAQRELDAMEAAAVRMLTAKVTLSPEEVEHERLSEDWDALFEAAFDERVKARIDGGHGEAFLHPTAKMFAIGIDSIRAGRPSELFLTFLSEIARAAVDRDVMSFLFDLPAIKKVTVLAAQREFRIAEEFRAHLSAYVGKKVAYKTSRNMGIGAKMVRRPLRYQDAIRSFKAKNGGRYSPKDIDRALNNRWSEGLEWMQLVQRLRKLKR